MPEFTLIKNEDSSTEHFAASNETFLHEDVLEILFEYKKKMHSKFNDIRGTFLIDHFAINIIDSNNKVIIFSATPSVEYNLISQNVWKYDKSFSARFQRENRFYSWETAYEKKYFEKLKLIKQTNHGFCFGFNLSKRFSSSQIIYSFATRYEKANLLEYYREHINELSAIGDYCYKAINESLEKNLGKIITATTSSPLLKLISNNKRNDYES